MEIIIFILLILLSFIVSFIAMFIASKFSGDTADITSIAKGSVVLSFFGILCQIIGLEGFLISIIGFIISLTIFIKLLNFEPMPAIIAGVLYGLVYYIILTVVLVGFFG